MHQIRKCSLFFFCIKVSFGSHMYLLIRNLTINRINWSIRSSWGRRKRSSGGMKWIHLEVRDFPRALGEEWLVGNWWYEQRWRDAIGHLGPAVMLLSVIAHQHVYKSPPMLFSILGICYYSIVWSVPYCEYIIVCSAIFLVNTS